jgi:uncharacterized Zn finger protein
MAELMRENDVLSFALRGIAETSGWQVDKLYDLACGVHERAGATVEVLALRRQQHERTPTASTYSTLRRAAEALGAWRLVAGEELLQTGRRAYARAIAMLKRARRAASASEQDHWFSDQLLDLREQHRRRPALIEMLDKAKLP